MFFKFFSHYRDDDTKDKKSLEESIDELKFVILSLDKKIKIYNLALKKLTSNKKVKKKYKKEVKDILKFYGEDQLRDIIALLEKNSSNLKNILSELYKQKENNDINEMLSSLDLESLNNKILLKETSDNIQQSLDLINAYRKLDI